MTYQSRGWLPTEEGGFLDSREVRQLRPYKGDRSKSMAEMKEQGRFPVALAVSPEQAVAIIEEAEFGE